MERVHLKIRRRDTPEGLSYWEEFSFPCEPNMTVLGALEAIGRQPLTVEGLPTAPVAHEHNCRDERCGACAMVINGRVRMACSTFVDTLVQPVVLEPMAAFPLVRDLIVDRTAMFTALGEIAPWAPLDGVREHDVEPRMAPHARAELFALAACIMCGACVDACPQVSERTHFKGAFLAAHALAAHKRDPRGEAVAPRIEGLKAPGGMGECANAGNCARACPKDIPLTEAIPRLQWEITKQSLINFLRG